MEVIHLEEVNSTNLFAKENVENLADKTIIHADKQTSGRGRLSREWVDFGEGNVFMTFVLKPSDTFNEIYSNLTQYLSVVLSKVLEEYGVEPQIKWPNDVFVSNRKIAGILCETVMQGTQFKGLALGIGINLTAEEKDFETIDKPVTSLNIAIGRVVDKNEFIRKLSDKFFANYDKFLEKGFEYIKNDYLKRASFLDKEVCVQLINEKKCGIAKSVNDRGELILAENNKEFVLTIGDIL